MKKKSKKMKVIGFVCTLTGMALALVGMGVIHKSKKYSLAEVSVSTPKPERVITNVEDDSIVIDCR